MQFPAHAAEHDIIEYVNWHCIHFLSNKVYHYWVVQEANKLEVQEWARKMLKSVELTDCFVDFTCDYILQVSRRKYGILLSAKNETIGWEPQKDELELLSIIIRGREKPPKNGEITLWSPTNSLMCSKKQNESIDKNQ